MAISNFRPKEIKGPTGSLKLVYTTTLNFGFRGGFFNYGLPSTVSRITSYAVSVENSQCDFPVGLTLRNIHDKDELYLESATTATSYFTSNGQVSRLESSKTSSVWATRTSLVAAGVTLLAAAYGNGRFVVGGAQGTMRTSTDGITWTSVLSRFGTSSINSIYYGNGVFLAGGDSASLRYSTDGVTWASVVSTFGNTNIAAVSYGNGLYLAAGNNSIRYSTNGLTWASVASSFGNLVSLTYGNGVYLAGDNAGGLYRSTDGITWSTVPSLFGTTSIANLVYGKKRFLAGGAGGTVRFSTNGVVWSSVISGPGAVTTEIVSSLVYGNNTFISGGSVGSLYSSVSGASAFVTLNSNTTLSIRSSAYGDGVFVLVGQDGLIRSLRANNFQVVSIYEAVTT